MKTMTRKLVLLAALLALAWVAWAQNSAVVGTWNCVATDQTPARWPWTLVISSNGGTLSGTTTGHAGTFPLNNLSLSGTTLTFSVTTSSQSYSVRLTVSGTTMSGTYSGSSSGKVTAAPQQ